MNKYLIAVGAFILMAAVVVIFNSSLVGKQGVSHKSDTAVTEQTESSDVEPNSAIEPIAIGDRIGDAKVSAFKIDRYPDNQEISYLKISFDGQIRIKGNYEYVSSDDEAYGDEIMVYYESDEDFPGNYISDAYHLDRPVREFILKFENESDKRLFGKPGTVGEVQLLVQNYEFLYAQTDETDTAVFVSNVSINSDTHVSSADEAWFSPDKVKDIKSLTDILIEPTINEEPDAWDNLTSSPIDYSADLLGESGGYFITRDKELLFAPLGSINDDSILSNPFYRYSLPDEYSSHLKLFVGQDANAILFDIDNGYISEIIISQARDSTQAPDSITITHTVRLQEPSKLSELTVVKYWLGGEYYEAIMTDDSGHIYDMNTSDTRIVADYDHEGWRTISIISNREVDGVKHDYLYETNTDGNVLRKFDLTSNQEVYQHSFSSELVNGKIIKVVSDFDIIYFLCDVDGNKVWYETNERTWNQIAMADKYAAGGSWGKELDDAWAYIPGNLYMGIAIFEPSNREPIQFLDLLQGWTTIEASQ
ncbi:hypothetical protein PCCS19_49180 [Paenibacillus sp. CCS19]|uniref:hypothetical protein n=1 Tax=Paenibacillus sp. CCS19 TaxID=3158387 RepID=UPI0025650C8F|nr:hypothetical protein [Paenibacillus cellulosilyticus]GMK41859.1 hypothetical protein PCCS19_49180 [Paenibacillus cellulosilyticus]